MVSPDATTTEASENFSEESEKMVHNGSLAPSQEKKEQRTRKQKKEQRAQKQKKGQQAQARAQAQKEQPPPPSPTPSEQPPPPSPTPSVPISNKTVAAKRHREEENDGTPELPSTKKKSTSHHSDEVPKKEQRAQKQKKEQRAQKQKKRQQAQKQKEQPPPPSPSPTPSAPTSNKTVAAKPPREEENNGTPVLPSNKKKSIAQHSDKVPASLQKSSKKSLRVWGAEDELALLNGLLDFSKGDKAFNINMNAAYTHIRKTTHIECTNKQFDNKFRRLRTKFLSLKKNMGGNDSLNRTNQVALYKLCKKLWGGQDEGEDGLKVQKTMGNAMVECGDLYSQMCKEWDDKLKKMKNNVVKELKESQSKKMAMIEPSFWNTRADMMAGVEKIEELEEKWHKQLRAEMKDILRRLKLLRKECVICLDGLGEPMCSCTS